MYYRKIICCLLLETRIFKCTCTPFHRPIGRNSVYDHSRFALLCHNLRLKLTGSIFRKPLRNCSAESILLSRFRVPTSLLCNLYWLVPCSCLLKQRPTAEQLFLLAACWNLTLVCVAFFDESIKREASQVYGYTYRHWYVDTFCNHVTQIRHYCVLYTR